MGKNYMWKKDEDCYPLTEKFVTEAKEKKIQLHVEWMEELGHQYPDHFSEILNRMRV